MGDQIQELKFQVGEAWKGAYSPATAYGLANVVQDTTGLSIYRSLKSGNVGHPLTDAAWWFCIIDMSSIKAESDRIAALNESIARDEALRRAAEELRQQHEAARETAEEQRDADETARIQHEQQRINAETARNNAEQQRIAAEQGRVSAESARVQAELSRVLAETLRANAEDARAAAEINRAAAEQQRIAAEQERAAGYAADHARAVEDHDQIAALVERADADHTQAESDHTRADSDHTTATGDHQQSGTDHTRAEADHTTATGDHQQATTDRTQAESDHSQAGQDHIRAEADHTQAAADHEAYATDVEETKERISFMEKSFGKYNGETQKVLSQAKAGKYVNVNGGETSASGYGISAPVTLNAGDILLVPSAQAVPADVSVIARLVDRTYEKVIVYNYTYRTDYPELPATATADYDQTLVYTAVYDESGETPVLTGWTRAGQTYETLPATREVSEQFYEPLMRQAVAAMPSTGYYIYLCPTAMTVVVSGLTATVSSGVALVVGWGIFKNISTNFVGAPGQSVLAQAFAVLFAAIDGLRAQLENLGETRADSIDFGNAPKLCGRDWVLEGNGAPSSDSLPTMAGQRYHDLTNNKVYEAMRVTGAVSDWVLLN